MPGAPPLSPLPGIGGPGGRPYHPLGACRREALLDHSSPPAEPSLAASSGIAVSGWNDSLHSWRKRTEISNFSERRMSKRTPLGKVLNTRNFLLGGEEMVEVGAGEVGVVRKGETEDETRGRDLMKWLWIIPRPSSHKILGGSRRRCRRRSSVALRPPPSPR